MFEAGAGQGWAEARRERSKRKRVSDSSGGSLKMRACRYCNYCCGNRADPNRVALLGTFALLDWFPAHSWPCKKCAGNRRHQSNHPVCHPSLSYRSGLTGTFMSRRPPQNCLRTAARLGRREPAPVFISHRTANSSSWAPHETTGLHSRQNQWLKIGDDTPFSHLTHGPISSHSIFVRSTAPGEKRLPFSCPPPELPGMHSRVWIFSARPASVLKFYRRRRCR